MRNAKQPRAPGSPEEWLDFAKSGLQMAEVGKRQLSIRRELVCFHAQQAAEKAIKGVLLSWKIDFPLTHDLEQLLELAERAGIPLPEAVQEAGA